jgi:hypothetical protein
VTSTGGEESGPSHAMLARLDESGQLDETFGSHGFVDDPIPGDGDFALNGLAVWNGKLVAAGARTYLAAPNTDNIRHQYVVARYLEDGTLDTTFNADGPSPGHIVDSVGSGTNSYATALAVDPTTGAATVTGWAIDGSALDGTAVHKLLLIRFRSDGVRDPDFRSASGTAGARLLSAGGQTDTRGAAVILDSRDGTLVAGRAREDHRFKFLLARFGDRTPGPNLLPVARIRGHHTVPRKTVVAFRGGRSFDPDGHIVEYAWRTGGNPFRTRGPVFRHRFGHRGTRVVSLRVKDDRGGIGFATFRVKVVSRRG